MYHVFYWNDKTRQYERYTTANSRGQLDWWIEHLTEGGWDVDYIAH